MKIKLTITINLTSSKYNDEELLRYWKKDDIEVMINDKTDEFIEKENQITS